VGKWLSFAKASITSIVEIVGQSIAVTMQEIITVFLPLHCICMEVASNAGGMQ